jgi:hypothetical protein
MPRFRRTIRPGDLVHVISRFVNEELRLTCESERDEYLRRLGKRLGESDWRFLSYAVMSSHVHLAAVAGCERFEEVMKSVHSPFSTWLNQRQGRRGPLFAERPKTLVTEPIWTARLIAYHHNNPVRAGVVAMARESEWTSHGAYMGHASRPDWLDVSLALELMGFAETQAGRRVFEQYVDDRRHDPRDAALTGDLRAANRELRERLGVAVSVAHPRTGPPGLDYMPRVDAQRWSGELSTIVEWVAREVGTQPCAVVGPARPRSLVSARRVVSLTARRLGRANGEIGLCLGVSEAAVRRWARTATSAEHQLAGRLADGLLGAGARERPAGPNVR